MSLATLSFSAPLQVLHFCLSTGSPPQHVVAGVSPQHPVPLQHVVLKLVGIHTSLYGVPSQIKLSGFKNDLNSVVNVLVAVLIEVTSTH